MTYQQIADVLGCTWQNVWMIERKAMAKLRRACKRSGMRAEELFR